MSGVKQLWLLRHAKSDWGDPKLPDHDRSLNDRGHDDASLMGEYIHIKNIQFDLVLCSSALRTRQTLEHLQLDSNTKIILDDKLYRASAQDLFDYIGQAADPEVNSILLVNHNPSITELAAMLTTDPDQIYAFPTAALAELHLPLHSWHDVVPGIATLKSFTTPKALRH